MLYSINPKLKMSIFVNIYHFNAFRYVKNIRASNKSKERVDNAEKQFFSIIHFHAFNNSLI